MNETLKTAYSSASGKLASDIAILCLKGLTSITDYFFICTADSPVQAKAIADDVLQKMKEQKIAVLHIEGYGSAGWVLVDCGAVIIHVFLKEVRDFYNLELLWADATQIEIP